MSPDLNTLPPSAPTSPPTVSNGTSRTHSPSAQRTGPSLAATAAMNAGIQSDDARRPSSGSMRRDVERARRRSSIRMSLNLNDPTVPAPGEMQHSPSARSRGPPSPHHERNPSLGELHQELEYEQEGQVNRLLHMIRQQQAHIVSLQATQPSMSAVDDSTPASDREMSTNHAHPQAIPRSRSPFPLANISRQSSFADRSRHGSRTGSPALRPSSGQAGHHDIHDSLPSPAIGRDESAFYQAETQNLVRENQMLKIRIRELERQLADMSPTDNAARSPLALSSHHSVAGRDSGDQTQEPS